MVCLGVLRYTKNKLTCYLDQARVAELSASAFFNSVPYVKSYILKVENVLTVTENSSCLDELECYEGNFKIKIWFLLIKTQQYHAFFAQLYFISRDSLFK
jgi:hypothetical protein